MKGSSKTAGAMGRRRPFKGPLYRGRCGPLSAGCLGIVCFCLIMAGVLLPGYCRAETAMIPMKFRSAEEALPIVRDLIAPGGRATADPRTNSLIITGDREAVEKIRGFLSRYDMPVRQAGIRLRFRETGYQSERSLSAEGRVSGKNWSVGKGDGTSDGIGVRLGDRTRRSRGDSEYFITAESGSWAYILVGKDIIFRERWADIYRRHVRTGETVTIHRIETGMEVRPVILEDRVQLEILPRISHGGTGRDRRIIRFAEASTRVTVPLGQWVDIGGTDRKSNEVIRAILESGRGEGGSSLSISILVESAP